MRSLTLTVGKGNKVDVRFGQLRKFEQKLVGFITTVFTLGLNKLNGLLGPKTLVVPGKQSQPNKPQFNPNQNRNGGR